MPNEQVQIGECVLGDPCASYDTNWSAGADGRFSANLHGVRQFDAADYSQATPGPITSDFRRGATAADTAHARDLNSGTNFRRDSVINVNGVPQNTTYVSSVSLTAGSVVKRTTAGTLPVTVTTGGVTTAPQNWTLT